ncbi:MAG: SDR family NAD(P)-dependent oxidoreductase [Terrimicrobiaceae bacterium]
MNLQNKRVLITGATGTSGVGFGAVQAVLEAGGLPIINGRSPEKLAEARERFPEADTVLGDIAKAEDVARMFDELAGRHDRIDCLVNNAGIGLHKAPHDCEEADFDNLVGVDFRGTWLVTRAWLRHLLNRNDEAEFPASAVNVSSVHAQKTMPGYGLYAGAKGAVDSFTRGLAVHYGKNGIRFNGVAPGYVHSDQNMDLVRNWTDDPAGWVNELVQNHQVTPQPIDPISIGRIIVFLLSDAASAISGQTITADAGNTALLFPNNFV